ncbi:MAG: preprotein translocase subunit YajC [Alphaproteobacteria bacterium]|nr:preprotein translocase subunit YajC [Alphaproteobacteria bacterium]
MFISKAFADTPAAAGAAGGFDFIGFLPLVLIFVVFYFLILRPQQTKLKQHQLLLSNLRKGDRVLTGGGIIGTISKLTNDKEVQVEIADGVKVRLVRSMITEVLAKTDPIANKDQDKAQSKTSKKEPVKTEEDESA